MATTYGDDSFTTISGRRVSSLNPKPSDVSIEDIAHALSRVCRFGGHVPVPYFVAQHSVIVSQMVPPQLAMIGLLHDASEAYVGDMITPIKHSIEGFEGIEKRWQAAIGQALLGDARALVEMPPEIHAADERAFHAEWSSMFPERPQLAEAPPRNDLPSIHAWDASYAQQKFLNRWHDLGGR